MINFEIEFKYDASKISLEQYHLLCRSRDFKKYFAASGDDFFYYDNNKPKEFIRHRYGTGVNELTFKKKLSEENNFIRTEHNISLGKKVSENDVKELCQSLGYSFNTKLMKHSFVYVFDWYILAYYICYDGNMNEIGRFFEIEIDEHKDYNSNKEAFNDLVTLETLFRPLGISKSQRILPSLFELFKKE